MKSAALHVDLFCTFLPAVHQLNTIHPPNIYSAYFESTTCANWTNKVTMEFLDAQDSRETCERQLERAHRDERCAETTARFIGG